MICDSAAAVVPSAVALFVLPGAAVALDSPGAAVAVLVRQVAAVAVVGREQEHVDQLAGRLAIRLQILRTMSLIVAAG